MTKTISPMALHQLIDAGKSVDLIDVRTPIEYCEIHAAHASNIPLDTLDPQSVMQARTGAGDTPLYVMCRSGKRAEKACNQFIASGYENVVNVEGGMTAWHHEGLPEVRGKKAISLERQIRISAGLLVLVGSLLAAFVNPGFGLLPAFVGGGLIFAGVFDVCGLGMILAKMPWNQVRCANDGGVVVSPRKG